jgi:hypothetical protein
MTSAGALFLPTPVFYFEERRRRGIRTAPSGTLRTLLRSGLTPAGVIGASAASAVHFGAWYRICRLGGRAITVCSPDSILRIAVATERAILDATEGAILRAVLGATERAILGGTEGAVLGRNEGTVLCVVEAGLRACGSATLLTRARLSSHRVCALCASEGPTYAATLCATDATARSARGAASLGACRACEECSRDYRGQ